MSTIIKSRTITFILALSAFFSVSVPVMSEPLKTDNSEETVAHINKWYNYEFSEIRDPFLKELLRTQYGLGYYEGRADTIKSLTIDDPRITSLYGLYIFTNLERLVLRGLSIKSTYPGYPFKKLSYLEIDQCDSIPQIYARTDINADTVIIRNCKNIERVWYSTFDHIFFQSCFRLKISDLDLCSDVSFDNCPHLDSLYIWFKTAADTRCEIKNCPNVTLLSVKGSLDRDFDPADLGRIDLSQLPKLTYLRIHDTLLKELDLSNCHKIKELDIQKSNLSELDISKCPDIEVLNVINNNLGELDLSNCHIIRKLDVSNNKLKELDFSDCPGIKEINVSHNNLETLDISKCPDIKEINVSHNNLETLDISKCPDIEVLDVGFNVCPLYDFSRNDKLTSLGCAGCGYTSIDVSKQTRLTYLDVSYNKLSTLDIRGLSDLKELRCEANELEKIEYDQKFYGSQKIYFHAWGNLFTAFNAPDISSMYFVGGDQYVTRELTTLPDGSIGVEVAEEAYEDRIDDLRQYKYNYELCRWIGRRIEKKAKITQAWGKNYLLVEPEFSTIDEIGYISYDYYCAHSNNPYSPNTNRGKLHVWIIIPSPTGIKQIREMNNGEEVWHTLNGVRLPGPPTQKGIYIKNGKKVTVK